MQHSVTLQSVIVIEEVLSFILGPRAKTAAPQRRAAQFDILVLFKVNSLSQEGYQI
jgi:hypothetical protein